MQEPKPIRRKFNELSQVPACNARFLMTVFNAGDEGLPYNPAASFALTSHAASLGDAEAQGNVGLSLAAGIHPPAMDSANKCELGCC